MRKDTLVKEVPVLGLDPVRKLVGAADTQLK